MSPTKVMIDGNTAISIAKSRGIGTSPVKQQDGSVLWKPLDSSGGSIGGGLYPSPEEAISAADILLADADSVRQQAGLQRVRQALEMGTYVPWPRAKSDGTGLEWGVMKVSDRSIGKVMDSWWSAAVEIAKLIGS